MDYLSTTSSGFRGTTTSQLPSQGSNAKPLGTPANTTTADAPATKTALVNDGAATLAKATAPAKTPKPAKAAAIAKAADSSKDAVPAGTLLDGMSRLLHFLFEEEADYLCGAPLHARSQQRVNYRIGYYTRKFRTHAGTILIRVPHLQHFHHRVPIVKRASRLSGDTLKTLARIHASGASKQNTSALIRTLWTVDLPDDLLAMIAGRLVLVLNKWRAGALPANKHHFP